MRKVECMSNGISIEEDRKNGMTLTGSSWKNLLEDRSGYKTFLSVFIDKRVTSQSLKGE
jgi:hypothetical protein